MTKIGTAPADRAADTARCRPGTRPRRRSRHFGAAARRQRRRRTARRPRLAARHPTVSSSTSSWPSDAEPHRRTARGRVAEVVHGRHDACAVAARRGHGEIAGGGAISIDLDLDPVRHARLRRRLPSGLLQIGDDDDASLAAGRWLRPLARARCGYRVPPAVAVTASIAAQHAAAIGRRRHRPASRNRRT